MRSIRSIRFIFKEAKVFVVFIDEISRKSETEGREMNNIRKRSRMIQIIRKKERKNKNF